MAFAQMARMVLVTLAVLAALGWVPWMLLKPLRDRLNPWMAAPFLGLAVLEVFSWYWLEYGQGGMRTGLVVLGALWGIGTVLVVLRHRGRGPGLLPPTTARGAAVAILVVGAAIVLSGLVMNRGLQGDVPVPTTFGNADTAQYALSAEVLLDEGFEGKGWILNAELGALGRSDNAGVRSFLASVAIVNGTAVWNATDPALAVFVALTAIAAMWLVTFTTRVRGSTAALLGLTALIPFSFVFIVGQQYLAQTAAMAGALALLAVALERRPTTWRESFATAVPATFLLVPMVLTYPQMAVASVLAFAAIVAICAVDTTRDGAIADVMSSMIRAGSVVFVAAAASLVILAPALGGLIDRVTWAGAGDAGWSLPLLSPAQILGVESFGPMTGISRTKLIGPVDTSPLSAARWWAGALLVIGLTAIAAAVAWRRRSRVPLFAVASSTAVLLSYRLVYDREGDSYVQWKWITFFQPLLTLAVVVALWTLADALLARFPNHRRVLLGSCAAMGLILVGRLLGPSVHLWSNPWWYVTEDLADVRRVTNSGVDRMSVALDPFAETMWAGYFLQPVPTNLASRSYFPTTGITTGWVLTKDPYVAAMPLRELPLNSTYRLVCYREPCSPAPTLGPP